MVKVNQKELSRVFNEIKNGNKESFNQFYELCYKLIYSIAFSIIKNKENSEDVTQNVLEKIYKMPKDSLPQSYEASWLYTVTKNETLQFIKKQKSDVNLDDIYEIEQHDKNIELMIDEDYYNRLMKKLKPKEQEIVTLKVISNLTFSEIGKLLDMPIGTVQWSYYKSINILKISLSTLAAVIITFVIGLKSFTQNGKNEIKNETKVVEKDAESTNIPKDNEANQTNIVVDNTTQNIQIVQVEEVKHKENNWQSYTLLSMSLIILVTGIIVIKKVKSKFLKKF